MKKAFRHLQSWSSSHKMPFFFLFNPYLRTWIWKADWLSSYCSFSKDQTLFTASGSPLKTKAVRKLDWEGDAEEVPPTPGWALREVFSLQGKLHSDKLQADLSLSACLQLGVRKPHVFKELCTATVHSSKHFRPDLINLALMVLCWFIGLCFLFVCLFCLVWFFCLLYLQHQHYIVSRMRLDCVSQLELCQHKLTSV